MSFQYTVGEFLKFVEENNIPMDAPILYQRIEDVYFENHGWRGKMMKSEAYHKAARHNADVDSGKYRNQEEYPNMTPEAYEKFAIKVSDAEMENLKDEYVEVFTTVLYDKEHVYFTAHY